MIHVDHPFHFGHKHENSDGGGLHWNSIDLEKLKMDRIIYDEFNVARFVLKPCDKKGATGLELGDCPQHKIDEVSIKKSLQSLQSIDRGTIGGETVIQNKGILPKKL
tara:strand:+ start:363 stop:683 length:321 start_codon:yes stop_codon:yes gene_type:complete